MIKLIGKYISFTILFCTTISCAAQDFTLIADSHYLGNVITFQMFDQLYSSGTLSSIGTIGPDKFMSSFSLELEGGINYVQVTISKVGVQELSQVYCSIYPYNFNNQLVEINVPEHIETAFVPGSCPAER